MEAREGEAGSEKAERLIEKTKHLFADVFATFHPVGRPGEVAGKSSNTQWAYKEMLTHYASDLAGTPKTESIRCQRPNCCHATSDNFPTRAVIPPGFSSASGLKLVHGVGDADTLWHPQYFDALAYQALEMTPEEAAWTIWQPPMLLFRNLFAVPGVTRLGGLGTLLFELAGLTNQWLSPHMCFSSYSLTLILANHRFVAGWDADVVAEDHHMFCKCFFACLWEELDGDREKLPLKPKLKLSAIYLPAQGYLVESSEGYFQSCWARFQQARRHSQGVAELGYVLLQYIKLLLSAGPFRLSLSAHYKICAIMWKMFTVHIVNSVQVLFKISAQVKYRYVMAVAVVAGGPCDPQEAPADGGISGVFGPQSLGECFSRAPSGMLCARKFLIGLVCLGSICGFEFQMESLMGLRSSVPSSKEARGTVVADNSESFETTHTHTTSFLPSPLSSFPPATSFVWESAEDRAVGGWGQGRAWAQPRRKDVEDARQTCPRRVSVCMTGALNSFTSRHVYHGIHENLRGSLFQQGVKQVDLFFAVFRGSYLEEWHGATQIYFNQSAFREAVTLLNPRNQSVDNKSGLSSLPSNCLDKVCASPVVQRMKCASMIQHAEGEDGVEYDYVIFTRPDVFWGKPFPALRLLAFGTVYLNHFGTTNGMNNKDHSVVLPRSFLTLVTFHVFTHMCFELPSTAPMRGDICGPNAGTCECYMPLGLAEAKIPIAWVDFGWCDDWLAERAIDGQCRHYPNTDLVGGDGKYIQEMPDGQIASTAAACCTACRDNLDCKGWTFSPLVQHAKR
ncbi:unnamed protein product [Polarella glacialis]|uniref:Uncharacterized protein n=1 Tax=Polarella glacialis TaxID=89957 RepID=A0A813HRE6_POLGL|nr:unnamed protein product [Polarella glacialis]